MPSKKSTVFGSCALSLLLVLGVSLLPASSLTTAAQSPPIPSFSHVFIVVEENAESPRVLDDPARYINQLAPHYSLATSYYAISHPSLPNYLAMVAGDTFGIASDCTDCFLDQPNLADQIEASGRSWRAYAESMPMPCFIGSAGPYAQTHNPFVYFDAIRTNPARCQTSIVPFSQFETDLVQDQLPDLSFIVPNLCNDGHDCSSEVEDRWTGQLVPLIVGSRQFQAGGVLFLTWDEGNTNASCCGGLAQGGQVATLIASPLARVGYRSERVVSHYSLLRTIEDAWGLTPIGHAAEVSPMTDVFTLDSN